MTHLIEQWQCPENVVAVQTSQSLISEQNFSVHPSHASPSQILALTESFGLPHQPSFLHQVHGNEIAEYHQPPIGQMHTKADACFTRKTDVICAVMTADCLPVLMTDIKGTFIAAVHCGWRSLFANILQDTLTAIKPDHQVLAWFGPCIQPAQYEVGDEFVEHYLAKHPDSHTAFITTSSGKIHADLSAMATQQLSQAGVTNIEQDGHCTYLSTAYHSWRQNQTAKRMATMAWLKQDNSPQ